MSAAVLVVHQGFDWVRTLQRGFERMVGTWIGLGLAAAVLTLHPQGLWLVLIIATLQFTIEMLIVRNYALAAVFITPIALTIASGGHRVDDVGGLLFARGMDTLIGCSLALVVYLMVGRRQKPRHVPEAVARVLDAIAATSRHLAVGAVSTEPAKAARRDLQIRTIAMMAAYDAGVDGTPRERRSAERMWPAVAATEQLAYRTLGCCWSMDHHGDDEAAGAIGRTLFGPDGVDRFTAALGELATAIRSGSAPPDPDPPATLGTAELTTIRDSLVRETAERHEDSAGPAASARPAPSSPPARVWPRTSPGGGPGRLRRGRASRHRRRQPRAPAGYSRVGRSRCRRRTPAVHPLPRPSMVSTAAFRPRCERSCFA